MPAKYLPLIATMMIGLCQPSLAQSCSSENVKLMQIALALTNKSGQQTIQGDQDGACESAMQSWQISRQIRANFIGCGETAAAINFETGMIAQRGKLQNMCPAIDLSMD